MDLNLNLNNVSIEKKVEKPLERNLLIDNYRGWVIYIVFVWCCMFLHISADKLPMFFFHTNQYYVDVAFGIMDYGMTFFMLASAMTFKLVFERRKKTLGISGAYMQSIKRGFGVMGIGMLNLIVKDIGDNMFSSSVYGWEVFGSIGVATIFATIFIDCRKRIRCIAGVLVILCYSFAFGFIPFMKIVGGNGLMPYGGPFMAIGCSGLMLIFSVAGELVINKEYFNFFMLYFGTILATIPTDIMTIMAIDRKVNPDFGVWGEMFTLGFYKGRPGYLIIGIPVSLTALIAIWGITELTKKPIILLADMGKNTLIYFFFFCLTHLVTSKVASYLTNLYLDMLISFSISMIVLIGLHTLIKLTKFSFTV